MTDTNRWELLSEEERLEVLELPYGWMLRNILQYGNRKILSVMDFNDTNTTSIAIEMRKDKEGEQEEN